MVQGLASNLTLAQAKAYALQNNPADFVRRIGRTEAAGSVVKEVRAARFPTVTGLATGVEAQKSTILAAGTLQTSSLYSRFASGIAVYQLVTDFGRTTSLTQSADLRRRAQDSNGQTVREQVLLQVEQAYFQALGGKRRVAGGAQRPRVNNREVTLRQDQRALAAERDAINAGRALRRSGAFAGATRCCIRPKILPPKRRRIYRRRWVSTMQEPFTLADVALPAALEATPDPRVQEAMRKGRPEPKTF